ncbi:MAG: hypothetical protein BGO26_09520 [Actinobacteria bacterium 69-20]|jgi:maleylpyruvate isomerase|nr:maleylpyruvate isomerase N-terminal domain-containing protein [Actinomycetota bacterium]OJV23170.1 MAG: hypothetical protein BGO26_09520 [Actinobacteria bacterium 69-20]
MMAMTVLSPPIPPTATAITALAAATDRLLATIDAMPAGAFTEPSVLPGWSRAHVLAHLALNAKGLAGVLTTIGQPDPLPMYASNERRDGDIDRLAAQPPARIADRVAVGASMLAAHLGAGPTPEDALDAVGHAGLGSAERGIETGGTDLVIDVFTRAAADASNAIANWSVDGVFQRIPGAPAMDAAQIPYMRWREVEIHHADLGLGYRPANWPSEFADYLFDTAAYDRDPETGMTLSVSDGRTMTVGGGGPVVRGSAADLAWWLVGRGTGEGLIVDGGEPLPPLSPWRRR